MIFKNEKEIEYIHHVDKHGVVRDITYVYKQGKKIWELIIGFLFTKDGYALMSKDGYMLKAKDQ